MRPDRILTFNIYSHRGGLSEGERLDEVDVVPVIAGDPGQVGLPDLRQLVGGELAGAGPALVEISVPDHRPLELVARQTLEGGAHQPPRH